MTPTNDDRKKNPELHTPGIGAEVSRLASGMAGKGRVKGMTTRRIGELLVEEGLIQIDHLREGLARQAEEGGKIVEMLISLGYLNAEAFVSFLAKQPGVASIDLSKYFIPRDIIGLIPREFAVKHEIIPIDRLGRLLTIAMVCPLDSATVRNIEERTGLRVKPLLCAPDDIRAAIERYYPSDAVCDPYTKTVELNVVGLNSTVKLSKVATMVRQVDDLPALPETVRRVQEAAMNPLSSVRDVADIIMLDPPIAAKVLGVANSAAYGFQQRIDDVTLAVTLLGLQETYSIVLSVAVVNVFEKSKAFNYRAFWISSICCAAATRIVAKASDRRRQSGLFSAGLLHDIGRLALAEVAPEVYARIDQNLTGQDLVTAEETILGLSHMEAGYLLATHWELPIEIAEPMRFHHRPELAVDVKENVAIVAIAAELAGTSAKVQESELEFLLRIDKPMRMLGMDMLAAEAMLAEYLALREECFHDSLLRVFLGHSTVRRFQR